MAELSAVANPEAKSPEGPQYMGFVVWLFGLQPRAPATATPAAGTVPP